MSGAPEFGLLDLDCLNRDWKQAKPSLCILRAAFRSKYQPRKGKLLKEAPCRSCNAETMWFLAGDAFSSLMWLRAVINPHAIGRDLFMLQTKPPVQAAVRLPQLQKRDARCHRQHRARHSRRTSARSGTSLLSLVSLSLSKSIELAVLVKPGTHDLHVQHCGKTHDLHRRVSGDQNLQPQTG